MAMALSLAACATRDVAYRFRAPLLSSVHAAPLPAHGSPLPAPGARLADLPAPHRSQATAILSIEETSLDAAPPTSQPLAGAATAGAVTAGAATAGAAMPEPAPAASGVVEILRGLVGQRDRQRSHIEFALLALDAIGVRLGPDARAHTTGAELMAWAESKDALGKGAPLPGDLVVFDKVNQGEPASLVGVVVAATPRDRGETVEFVYLARGVVRRGYVSPRMPTSKRDPTGRALNTFVRHLDGKTPKNDEFLAGELFRAYVRIDRLAGDAHPE
jgi:hypothetical protein